MTKLESLIEVLKVTEFEELEEQLILDYYNEQNRDSFISGPYTFLVLSERDEREILYDKAADKFDDTIADLEDHLIRHAIILPFPLSVIDEPRAIERIIDRMDIEGEEGLELIGESNGYNVYRQEF